MTAPKSEVEPYGCLAILGACLAVFLIILIASVS